MKIDFGKYNPYDSFRLGQEEAITKIIAGYEGKNKIINIDAPTASGKTATLYTAGRILEHEYGVENIVFTSPQVALITEGNLFDLPKLVGKKNYKCCSIAEYTAEECPFRSTESGFASCGGCAYREAKARFKLAKFRATTFARYQADPSIYIENRVLFVDESTNLPNALLDSATLDLDFGMNNKNLNIEEQKTRIQQELKALDIGNFIKAQADKVEKVLARTADKCRGFRKDIISPNHKPSPREVKLLRNVQKDYTLLRRDLQSCSQALRYISMEVPYVLVTDVEDVYNPFSRKKEIKVIPRFKLLDAKIPFSDLVASLDFIVLASGTPTTELLTNKHMKIVVPHPIPKERRLIYYDPIGPMTKDARFRYAKPMAERIKQLHDTYSEKTIVHCGNYQIARLIDEHLCRLHNTVFVQAPDMRNVILRDWMKSSDGIFLSVAFEQGLNLEGPEYPMNVICKVPFPNLGDEWIQARNSFDNWYYYNLATIIQVEQACGRTTRNPTDMSETHILDASFGSLYNRTKSFWMPWFKEALVV